MADAIVSEVVGRIATMLEDKIRYEVNLVKGVKKELQNLSKKLNKIRMVLDDAEKKAVNDQIVKSWLKELEATSYEMDDILDEWNYSLLKHKMEDFAEPEPEPVQKRGCSFIPSSCLCFNDISFRRDIAKKIEHVKARLEQIYKDRNDFNFVISLPTTDPVPVPESHREQSTSSIDFNNVCGSDIYKKRDDIMKNMMVNGDDTQILSIVGTGGLGKTTLAQLIFNHPQFEKDWLKIWVCVSDPFIATVVAKNIVESVGTETIPPNTNQLELVLQKVKASVSGKKFLLVLDDVWTDDNKKWEPLQISLQCGAVGSKILVTTRKETVAKMFRTLDDDMYHPNKLSEEECWSLLRDTSLPGKSEKECGKFEDVGKKIASKCNGLPLAAVVLGRLLQFKDLEGWEHVEKSEIWELENAKVELFPHLVLSYNELSPTLKRCFSYCAVYPKGRRIHAETLIEEWMAQGYLGSDSGNGAAELKGRENLRNLAMRSLFQDIEKSESGEQIEWCKMHDIVHDFALSLRKNDEKETSCQVCDSSLVSHVQEYRSLSCIYYVTPVFERDRSFKVCDCMKSVRVFRIERSRQMGMETLIHLRWLDISFITLSKDDLEIICRLYFLQTLLLSGCNLTEIPQQIGSLNQLRRLDLSNNGELKELPESMGSLVELRTLSLADCSLKVICRGIGNLVQLRRLDLSWNRELKELPESMGSLVELRTLSLAHCSLEEIGREIGNLVQLRQLDLRLNDELKELPESMGSLVELQILKIEGTSINCLPEALGELSNLHTLGLCPFKVGSQYNKLGLLKNLYRHHTVSLHLKIYLSSMSEMVDLVEDARQAQLNTLLQELETLEISFNGTMNEMEQSSIWMEVVEALVPHHKLNNLKISGYEGSRLPHWMSSPLNFIKQIYLRNLSEVSSLPAMGKLPSLEILSIYSAEQLMFVGREFLGIESSSHDIVVVAFPKLKQLTFHMCRNWEEWEDVTEEEEESAAISIMPCLTELTIESCESLKKLPHRLLRKVSSSLLWMDISGSSELVKTYGEDEEGSAWRSISQLNPQLHLQLLPLYF
ncbi:putative disease resistance protein RGA1 [Salvia splendens]|uniref:putative disease resistance protein RGA1 n=1 Tax=Salvia splendens TaxID=180675 RepID=UPI0011029FAF|nr:putative disease resistance protein RGA1 [Salvia splendens]